MKQLIKWGMLLGGHYRRRLQQRPFPGVAVLCYHGLRAATKPSPGLSFDNLHVAAPTFEAHCRALLQVCNPISLSQWRDALAGGAPLPPRALLITFDDGYRTVFTLARPILARYRIPAVLFICSGSIADRRLLWYDALARRSGEAEVSRASKLEYDAWRDLVAPLTHAVADDDPQAPLRVDELRQLAADPRIEIGGHTVDHPILSRLTLERQREQMIAGKQQLESWCGKPVTAFAYPFGAPGDDYSDTSVYAVRESGFDVAFTTDGRFATAEQSPFERSRFVVLAAVSEAELVHRLTYAWPR